MIRMRRAAAFFSILPLVLAGATIAAKDMEVAAMIQEVNPEDRSVTVKMEDTGATQTFRVAGDTAITLDRDIEGGAAARQGNFGDLQSGQEVTLRFDDKVMDDTHLVILHLITVS